MKRIAIAMYQGKVSEHFGYCDAFYIADIEDNTIINATKMDSPGHRPGFLPDFLMNYGVNVIIAGGMGESAVTLFLQNHMEVYTGAQGTAKDVLSLWIEGKLVSSGTVCHEHQHHDECH
jgi:predicted Fe-Mo cluster-binding NifX family protein